jgi:hypothetical protein
MFMEDVSSPALCGFFITYNHEDADWAEWIGVELEGAGFTTVLDAWDFRPGDNFVVKMDKALAECRHALGVLSPSYLESVFARAEWTAAYRQTLLGKDRGFIPVRIRKCDLSPLLGNVIYIDLVGTNEDEARRRLLDGVTERTKRSARRRPGFPGSSSPRKYETP